VKSSGKPGLPSGASTHFKAEIASLVLDGIPRNVGQAEIMQDIHTK